MCRHHQVVINWAICAITLALLISPTTAIKCYQCYGTNQENARGVCTGDDTGELKDCGNHNSCRIQIGMYGTYRFCCYIPPERSLDGSCSEGAGSIDCHCTEDGCNYEACKCKDGVPVKGTGVPRTAKGDDAKNNSKGNAGTLFVLTLSAILLLTQDIFKL